MKAIGVIFLVIVILVSFAACDGYAVLEKYPYYQSDCWYCKEIDFTFYYDCDEDGLMKPIESYPLIINGETLYVFIDFMGSNWFLDLDNKDNNISQEERLLFGTWLYRKGDLVLIVEKDNLFDWKYTELVFVANNVAH